MAMSEDPDSCKLCDNRLICTSTKTMSQQVLDYTGARVEGRKYPSISTPENVVEAEAIDQKLFFFGGFNTMYQYINDQGFFMYDARENHMRLMPINDPSKQKHL